MEISNIVRIICIRTNTWNRDHKKKGEVFRSDISPFLKQEVFLCDRLFVERRIICVEILRTQVFLNASKSFSKSLEMHDLALTQEPDGITDLRVLYEAKDVVIGGAGFLFCCNRTSATSQNFQ